MTLLSKKINLDFTDRMASLAALHLVKNFKLCNKHQALFARHLSLITNMVSKRNIALQLDAILQHCNLLDFTKLVCKNPEWFLEQMKEIIGGIKKPD